MYAVELHNISKTFPGNVQANKDVTIQVRKGEVLALLGENGAGKSTIVNILYGLISKDAGSGKIIINGEEVLLKSPQDAINRGVGMVHQHFKLIPPLSVTENVVLGLEPPERNHSKQGLFILFLLSIFSFAMIFSLLPLEVASITSIALSACIAILYFSERLFGNRFQSTGGISGIILKLGGITNSIIGSVLPIGFSDAEERIEQIAIENGLHIDPKAKVQDLSVGLQQRVEIIKTLYREAEILILDEPTAVLTPQEVDELFVTLKQFKEQGKTIILITHKLKEPMALADRICVLRDGELVGIVNTEDTSPALLAEMMVGRPVLFDVDKSPSIPGDVALSIGELEVKDNRDMLSVNGISIDVKVGEIYGIAGVGGNGQTELVEAITGLRKISKGHVIIAGHDMTNASPRKIREVGLSHIPQDRHKRGLILDFSVEENLVLGSHYLEPFSSKLGILNLEKFQTNAIKLVQDYSIRISDVQSAVNTLSGGNQQKIVVARELSTSPIVVIAAQPTRGLDIGATEYIHKMLIELRDAGVAVLLISAELDEIRSLSDRIGVIFDGKIVAVRKPDETDSTELGLLMAGHIDGVGTQEGLQ